MVRFPSSCGSVIFHCLLTQSGILKSDYWHLNIYAKLKKHSLVSPNAITQGTFMCGFTIRPYEVPRILEWEIPITSSDILSDFFRTWLIAPSNDSDYFFPPLPSSSLFLNINDIIYQVHHCYHKSWLRIIVTISKSHMHC